MTRRALHPTPAAYSPPGENPWRRELREMLALALPLVGSQLAFIGINTTDAIMVGRLGPQALASWALAHNLYFPVWLFCMGVLTAVAPIAAQARGARNPRMVRRAVRQGFWVAILLALPSWAGLAQMEALLLFFGQTPANAALSQDYTVAYLLGWLPSFGFIVLRVFLATMDLTRWVFFTMTFCVGLNVFLNYVFIFGNLGMPALGLPGAGYASAIVFWTMFLVLLGYAVLGRRLKRYVILGRFWRPDWQVFAEILRVGLPIGGTIVMEAALFGAAGLMMGLIGTLELAAHTIALQCVGIAFMLPLGVSQAATIRVGFFVGRRDEQAVRRSGWTAFALGLCFAGMTTAAFLLAPETLMSAFLDDDQANTPGVMAFGVTFLALAGLFQIFDATQVVSVSNLRGLKDTKRPMLIAAFCYWGVGFPASWLLAFELGLAGAGIWMGLALGLAFAASLLTYRWMRREALGLVRL